MNRLLKKIVTLLATVMIFVCAGSICNPSELKAEGETKDSNGCIYGKVENLAIEDNKLVWDHDTEDYDGYIEILSGDNVLGSGTWVYGYGYDFLKNISTNYTISQPGTYSFRVWIGNKTSEGCGNNYAELTGVTVRRMGIRIRTNGEDSTAGGSAYFYVNDSQSDSVLAVDSVIINTNAADGYYPLFRDSSGKEFYPSGQYRSLDDPVIKNTIDISGKFADDYIYVDFVNTPIDITVDLGENHTVLENGDSFAEKFAAYGKKMTGNAIDFRTVENDPSKVIMSVVASSLAPVSNVTAVITYFMRDFLKENTSSHLELHNNEIFAGACYTNSVKSFTELGDMVYSDVTIAQAENKVYVIWLRYEDAALGNNSWTKGDSNGLTLKFKRNISDKGESVEDDGQQQLIYPSTFSCFKNIVTVKNGGQETTLTPNKDYTYGEGSLIINLNKDYLNTLEIGDYVLEAAFNPQLDDPEQKTNVYAYASFTVKQREDTVPDITPAYAIPRTGIE